MSAQTDLLRELVARFNARQEIEVERYFSPNFQLDQPGGICRSGLAGARDMVQALLALGPLARLEILSLVEERDLVAVRWHVSSANQDGSSAAMLAFYRFEDGRIAEDWGVAVPYPWRG